MQKHFYITWALALLAVTILWAYVMTGLTDGFRSPYSAQGAGRALGAGLPVYISSAIVPLIVLAITRRPTLAMWIWTALTASVLLAFTIGGTITTAP